MKTGFLSILLGTCLTTVAVAQSSAVIHWPPADGPVATHEDVKIEMRGPGLPVIAIRSLEKGDRWWIQRPVQSSDSQHIEVPARFGNDRTPNGTRFQLAVGIVASSEQAASLAANVLIDELPPEMDTAEIREVVLERSESGRQRADFKAELLYPTPQHIVERVQLISLRLQTPAEELPRLLVRAGSEASDWWVQEPLREAGEGTLEGSARIGNEHTAPGSVFLLLLVVPTDQEARAALKTGAALRDLSAYRCSHPIAIVTGAPSSPPQPSVDDALSKR
jgi:hypothetical protein